MSPFKTDTHAPLPPCRMRMPTEETGPPLCRPRSEDCLLVQPGDEVSCPGCLRKLQHEYGQFSNFLAANGVTFAKKAPRKPRAKKKKDKRQLDFADLEER